MKSVTPNCKTALCAFTLLLISGCVTTPEEKLRQAVVDGNLLRVRTFLEQGVNAQTADARGITPLHLAAKHGHRNMVEVLLERVSAVNLKSQDGITPLSIAVQEGRRELVALLLEKGAQVQEQVQIGGATLLHVAAYRGNQEIISLLLQHGADKQARMTSGERPVDLAQQQGHTTLIPLLEP